MTMKFSVQICSYNRWHLLKRALEALFSQNFPKDEYEIVFVDDGSTDTSLAMAQELANTAPCRLRVLTKPNDGLSRARNLGIRNCEGEILLFMDDDTFADPNLLKEHWLIHQQHPNAVVMGWVNHIEELDPQGPRKYVMADYSRSFFWTSNVSVRKKYIDQVGGFDEDFREYGWEDMELGYRLKQLGLQRHINEKAIVSHFKPPKQKKDLPGMIRQAESSARSALIYIKKRPGLRSRMATGITGFRMGLDLLFRPLRPLFQGGIDNAPDGPLQGWAWWCARMLCSFHFFDVVRSGDSTKPGTAK